MNTVDEAGNIAIPTGPRVHGSLPLYVDPQAVHSGTHRNTGVRAVPNDYAFASTVPMVQITVDEFERSALDYPIVFFGEDRQPYAITGLALDTNLFVTDGAYRSGAYIPAYLRRYPFVFARDESSEALILCLDHASDCVVDRDEDGAQALFDGNEPTALTRQALSFCEGYEAANARTRAFVALAEELGLFEPKRAHYTPAGEATPILLLEYATIDRARLDALSADAFQKIRDAHFVAPAYAVVASQAEWDVLPLLT